MKAKLVPVPGVDDLEGGAPMEEGELLVGAGCRGQAPAGHAVSAAEARRHRAREGLERATGAQRRQVTHSEAFT